MTEKGRRELVRVTLPQFLSTDEAPGSTLPHDRLYLVESTVMPVSQKYPLLGELRVAVHREHTQPSQGPNELWLGCEAVF